MIRLFLLAALSPLAAVPSPSVLAAGQPEPLSGCQVIARVGKQVVLSCEVEWRVNLLLEKHADQIPPNELDALRRQLVQQNLTAMLDMKLLYADFRSKAPEANLAAIHQDLSKSFDEDRVPQLMKELGVEDPSQIDARMRQLGGSLEDVRQDFYQTTIAQSWLSQVVKIDRTVTHQQLLDYYRENAARYDYPAQARWEELMVRFRGFPSKNAAWKAIAKLGNEAFGVVAQAPGDTGQKFSDIARRSSQGFTAKDGGAHDWTTKGALAAARIDEALFSLPIGEMSPILESGQGFHIVRVLERKTAGRKSFVDVQAEIREKIVEKRFNTELASKLKELRRSTQIWTLYAGSTTAEEYISQRQRAAAAARR